MTSLKESGQTVSLGPGYALRTPGWRGIAEIRVSDKSPTRTAIRGLDDSMDALDAALGAAHVTEVRQLDLVLQPAASGSATSRNAVASGDIELEVPDLGPEIGQLVLSIDDAGALRWHLPEPAGSTTSAGVSRGTGGPSKVFRIPATVAPPIDAPRGEGTQRSVLGVVGRKLLKVLVYPLTDPILGAVGEHFVNRWEAQKRPYRVRSFAPQDFKGADAVLQQPEALAVMAAKGRVLMFVHGTFSISHAAFGALPSETMSELHRRYDGRVIAFDHPTVGVDPAANAQWLLGQLPARGMDLDIVCHSRGGLVSRILAESPATPEMDTGRVRIHRIVFAATPNNGTVLADPDHLVDMVDRLTTLLTLFPTGPVTETLEALITVVKVLAHGVLSGLDGLASMRPQGQFLPRVNRDTATSADYFAIAANYAPTDAGLRGLIASGADRLVDAVFGDAGNDLVVPTEGVFQKNGGNRFPLDSGQVLLFDPSEGVSHTTLFRNAKASERLLEWLA